MTALSHNRGTVHLVFKICISRNMKCDKTVGFLKYSHIYIYIYIYYILLYDVSRNPYGKLSVWKTRFVSEQLRV